jgi:hypothetical protein
MRIVPVKTCTLLSEVDEYLQPRKVTGWVRIQSTDGVRTIDIS